MEKIESIEKRMASTSTPYNMSRYATNLKFLKEKVKFFDKKKAEKGDLGFLAPRAAAASRTLERLQGLKIGKPTPAAANLAAAAVATLKTASPAKATKAKTATKPKSVKANNSTVRLSRYPYNNRPPLLGENGLPLQKRVVLGVDGKPLRIKKFTYVNNVAVPKASKPSKASKASKEKETVAELPSLSVTNLYNPFTGSKFLQTNDAIGEIKRAEQILRKSRLNNTLRRIKEEGNAKRAAKAAKALGASVNTRKLRFANNSNAGNMASGAAANKEAGKAKAALMALEELGSSSANNSNGSSGSR